MGGGGGKLHLLAVIQQEAWYNPGLPDSGTTVCNMSDCLSWLPIVCAVCLSVHKAADVADVDGGVDCTKHRQ